MRIFRYLFLRIRARWRCFRAGGHVLKWFRNIYGDQIHACDGNRSEWVCTRCGSYHFRSELYQESSKK